MTFLLVILDKTVEEEESDATIVVRMLNIESTTNEYISHLAE